MSRITARFPSAIPWLSLFSRLVGGAIFGWAALSKIGDPAATARAVRAYRLLPESLVGPVAHALPAVELALAALLLAGLATRIVGLVASAAVAVFIAAVASAGARGLKIDCGCFGGGGLVTHTHYLLDIARDSVLLVLLAVIPLAATSRFSLDNWLDRRVDVQRPGTKRARLAAARAAALAAARRRQRVAAGLVAALCLAGAAVGGNVAAAASTPATPMAVPAGATASGGILVGSPSAAVQLLAYEDPQCPICGQFEKINGATLQAAVTAGKVGVEYRMRSFLGPESVRADNALAAAQNEGKFEKLREAMYANQPEEHTGGFTTSDLLSLGRSVGLDDAAFTDAVKDMTYARWVAFVDVQASKDGDVGTPELVHAGQLLTQQQTFDPSSFKAALGIS
jgi:protein-disulfide isomerase